LKGILSIHFSSVYINLSTIFHNLKELRINRHNNTEGGYLLDADAEIGSQQKEGSVQVHLIQRHWERIIPDTGFLLHCFLLHKQKQTNELKIGGKRRLVRVWGMRSCVPWVQSVPWRGKSNGIRIGESPAPPSRYAMLAWEAPHRWLQSRKRNRRPVTPLLHQSLKPLILRFKGLLFLLL